MGNLLIYLVYNSTQIANHPLETNSFFFSFFFTMSSWMTKLSLGTWNGDLRSKQVLDWIWETWVWIAVFLPIQSEKSQSSWKESEVGTRELTMFILLPLGRELRHSKLDECGGCESIWSTDFRDDSKQAFDFWSSVFSLSFSFFLFFFPLPILLSTVFSNLISYV